MIKALFFDIDGTLVSFNTHEIPTSTIEAMAAAKAKGIKIFIATGRPKAIINILSPIQDLNLIDGYITMNGGYCFVGDEVIYKKAIPTEDVQTLARLSDKKNFPCIFVAEHKVTVCNANELVNQIFHEFLHVDILPVKPTAEVIHEEIFQMTPFITTEEEKDILHLLPHCESGRWFPAFTDVVSKGISKQKGINEMIRHFGIRLEDTMAFGDGGNDIPMLRHAAIGIAMGNANPEVQQVADYVTTSVDEDGIWKAMKHFEII